MHSPPPREGYSKSWRLGWISELKGEPTVSLQVYEYRHRVPTKILYLPTYKNSIPHKGHYYTKQRLLRNIKPCFIIIIINHALNIVYNILYLPDVVPSVGLIYCYYRVNWMGIHFSLYTVHAVHEFQELQAILLTSDRR